VISVSVPVMIISLEDGGDELCMDETLDIIIPLPWLESCCMYM
jgi:hypothetical protein